MTEEEKQEIIEAVLAELNSHADDVEEMPVATSLTDTANLVGVDENGDYINTPMELILVHHITLTQEEYDELVDTGMVDDGTYYYTYEQQ